jgi:predicted signal transduction protein with EAL and GGDEF domain
MPENVLIDNPDEAKLRLDALRGLGVKIALDDFGTSYSSLSNLHRFAFDKLKIDKAFVTPLGRTASSGAMIQAIVALGNALGLSILPRASKPKSNASCCGSPGVTKCRASCSPNRVRARRSIRSFPTPSCTATHAPR